MLWWCSAWWWRWRWVSETFINDAILHTSEKSASRLRLSVSFLSPPSASRRFPSPTIISVSVQRWLMHRVLRIIPTRWQPPGNIENGASGHHAHRMSSVSRLITYRTIHISTWWNRLCFLSSSEYDFTYTIQNILCHKLCPNLSKFDWISPIITGFHWVRDATVTPENKYT